MRTESRRRKEAHSVDDVHTLEDLAEDDVTSVEPRSLDGGDEESARNEKSGSSQARMKERRDKTHCEPFVSGPALAIDISPGWVWRNLKSVW